MKLGKSRRHAVLVRLDDFERDGLAALQKQEFLPAAQVVRRLLIREILATRLIGGKEMKDC